MAAKILMTGSIMMDLILQMPRIPHPSESLLGTSYSNAGGGKGSNSAVAACKAGGEVSVCGTLGKDSNGEALLGMLTDIGIDVSNLTLKEGANTGMAVIMLEEDGMNRLAIYTGANNDTTPEAVDAAFEGKEYDALMKLIAHLREVLGSERLVFDIIKEELLEIKDKYGDERKTKIVAAEGEFDMEDLIKEEQCVVALTHFGYIKRMPIDTYKSQKRGGKGITGIATREEDFVKQIFTASTHDTILFFSNKGKAYRLRGYEVPEAGRTAKGTAIVNLLSLDGGEKISAVIPIANFAEGKYLLMTTKNGLIKKTSLNEFISVRKSGLIAINLKEEDTLIDVKLTDGEDNVVLVTEKGMSITFDEKDVRPIGRNAMGVIGIKLDENDSVIGMESIIQGSNATLLSITENGFGKRTELDEYRVQSRGGRGVMTYKITPKTGNIVGIRIASDDEDVMLITDTGTIIRLKVSDISILGRVTQGVTLMRTNEGKVVSIETIPNEEKVEEE